MTGNNPHHRDAVISNLVVPSLGATGGDIVIDRWLVAEGDLVEASQPVLVATTVPPD